jgi:hypothetical protein
VDVVPDAAKSVERARGRPDVDRFESIVFSLQRTE